MVRSTLRVVLNFFLLTSGWVYVVFLKLTENSPKNELIYPDQLNLEDSSNLEHSSIDHVDFENVEILKPMALNSEYGIKPFYHFTTDHIEFLEGNLKRHPRDVFSENEFRAKELFSVIAGGAKALTVDKDSFIEGYARLQEDKGMEYELYFDKASGTFFKGFSEMEKVRVSETIDDQVIHFIMPFSTDNGHEKVITKLSEFVKNFKQLIDADNNVWLTISWLSEKNVVKNVELHKKIYAIIKELVDDGYAELLFTPNTSFTRGKALDFGIKTGKNKQATQNSSRLLFMVDVDIYIQSNFLHSCRNTPIEGKRVFYPVVFSLYNPRLVYDNQGFPKLKIFNFEKLRKIHKDFGFWRDFGFGMSCQFETDYKMIGGFDLDLKGWGLEDVLLYRNYVQNNMFQVIRSPVPSLFHDWHPKVCTGVSDNQMKSCLKSKALTEGNQVMLGMQLFEHMQQH